MSVPVLGTKWLTLGSLPWLSPVLGGRLLLVGETRAALFSTDYNRQHLVELLWSGMASELRWRRMGRWLFRLEVPNGHNFYVDAVSERRKLEAIAPGRT